MNAAQHAGQILQAWKFRNVSHFETALNDAFSSCTPSASLSHLESERAEVLQSVIEHLRTANREGKLPEYLRSSGARTLLSHLSSDFQPKEESEANRSIFSTKNLNFGMERAKCFVEVECRPRAYAG